MAWLALFQRQQVGELVARLRHAFGQAIQPRLAFVPRQGAPGRQGGSCSGDGSVEVRRFGHRDTGACSTGRRVDHGPAPHRADMLVAQAQGGKTISGQGAGNGHDIFPLRLNFTLAS